MCVVRTSLLLRERIFNGNLSVRFFFFQQRLDVAKQRIESLNPLVNVETITDPSVLGGSALENLVQKVDLVCVTDYDRDSLVSLVSRPTF